MSVQLAKLRLLEEIGEAYAALHPGRYRAALDMVREARAGLVVPSGMSSGGTMRWSMRVPADLFFAVRRFIPDFGQDEGDWDLLLRAWPDLRVGGKTK